MNKRLALIAAVPLVLAAQGCTTATPYQPANVSDMRNGYSDYRVAESRFRVTFSGNSMTSRETVERYLLFRAAELTLQQGYDTFTMADRNTERRSRSYVDHPFDNGPYGWWGPSWSYRGRGFGWRRWDPFWGDPFWDHSIDVRTVDQYQAMAEIVMTRGRPSPGDVRAFDARQVIDNLRNSIVLPQ